ncbi:hypothetical protein E2C01_000659 [Portunus trituberculatus]|uniref:Uncharacterized protein n=1 Tax=Portunus trituberculatus TaxID=210409 RepID=A0A5B7CF90_PORTR|nr:hypothetical protein [Portunus trituberculatus]
MLPLGGRVVETPSISQPDPTLLCCVVFITFISVLWLFCNPNHEF